MDFILFFLFFGSEIEETRAALAQADWAHKNKMFLPSLPLSILKHGISAEHRVDDYVQHNISNQIQLYQI